MSAAIHRYGRHRSQVGELFLPGGAGPHPVVVLIHGGFWRARYDRHLMDDLAADLAGAGWAAWNVEYRRARASGGGWPATFDDVAAAIDDLQRGRRAARPAAASSRSGTRPAGTWRSGRPGARTRASRSAAAVGQAAVVDLAEAVAAGRVAAASSSELLGGTAATRRSATAGLAGTAAARSACRQLLVHGGARRHRARRR